MKGQQLLMQDQNWLCSLRPLPSRVIPFPEEDLASLVCRSAQVMGYKYVQWLLPPEEVPCSIGPVICTLQSAVSYRILERLFLLSEERLYRTTFHRFTTQLQAPEETHLLNETGEIQRPVLTRITAQRFISSQQRTRVCPLCLAERESYGRLYWGILPVIVCPRHHIMLADRCPMCQEKIPVLRSSLTRCPRCRKGDYRQAPIVLFGDEPLLHTSQAFILDHLGVEENIALGMTNISKSPLAHLTSWQYFRLLDAFRYVLSPLFPDHPFLRTSSRLRPALRGQLNGSVRLSIDEWLVLIATFHNTFESWPDNFFELLASIPLARDHISKLGIRGQFGTLYDKWLYKRLEHSSFSLYIKLRTSPLDTGLEQEYTCSIQLLNTSGKVSFLHPARPIMKARTSSTLSLSRTDHGRVALRAPQ
jgi:hypothetical protein